NNIIAGNFDTTANAGPGDIEPDMDGTSIASDGHNLIGDNSGETVTFPVGSPNANDDYVGDSATALDPLLVRSDSTPVYYTFDFNSEAYNNGDNGQIVTINSLTGNAGTDQRHFPRLDGITIDIGAVEMDFLAVIDPADSGFGTLRNRLDTANSRGHGTIIFLDTVFPGPTTITLTTGELPITGRSGISICATDTAPITIEATGPPPSRVMLIGASVTGGPPVDQRVLLKNLTLTGGDVIGSGGAIQVDGNFELTLDCCVLEGNTASLDGGAIAGGFLGSTAQLILTDTTFENNTARNGGAIAGFLTGIEARRCSFIGNSASSEGGALYLLDGPGTFGAEFFNCTISANTADQGGGGVMAQSGAVATFIHCTLTDNRSNDDGGSLSGDTEDGGGIHQIDPASVTIGNSIIAGNMNFSGSGGVDVEGKFISLGGNLVGTLGSATGFNAITDTFGTATAIDPLLGALAFNGAKTQNHRPLVGSPVAGLGETANASGLDTDQRGAVRIQGIDPEAGSIEYRADTISVTPGTLSFTEGSGLGTGIFFDRLFTNEELVIPLTVTGGSLDDIVLQLAGSVGSFDGSQITFPPGESQITLTITTVDDKLVEGTEVLDISVVGDEFATDGDSSVVTIDDNDLLVTNFTDSGPGRLREVLLNLPDGGTAIIPADPSGPVITLNSAIIIDGKSVEVCGPSTNGVGAVIDAQDLSHHFSIINSGVLNVENLTLTRGNSLVNGGSIINNGELNATACTFTENAATDAGGAIWANGSAVTNLTSNTFSSNEAGTQGGALFLSGNAILLHNTLTKNNATTQGGGIFTAGGTTSAQNTIIAGNTAPTNSDVTGTVSSNGGNLVGDGAGSTGFTHATDQVGTSLAPIDPVIGPLAMNGGPTMTHALWVGSPAIDGGRNLNIPVTDQRGLDRINDEGDPDIGAYEHQTVPFDYWAAYQAANQSLIAPSPPVITINTDGDGDGARDGIEFICGTDPFDPNDFLTLTPSLTTSGFLIAYPHSAIASEEEAILRFADINDPDDFDISPDAYVYPGPSAGNTRTRRGSVGRTGIPFFLGRLEYSDPGAAQ
ncbi:MAG: choice-of-anchor Q domain-containing protein, partial [Verrucomicrobiota bacterium]